MPDSPTEPPSGGPDPYDLDRRVRTLEISGARLEQIVVNIDTRLNDIVSQMRDMRAEMRDMRAETREMRAEFRGEFRSLLSNMMGGFGLMLTAYLALLAAVGRAVHWW
jgi:hypothetical protein